MPLELKDFVYLPFSESVVKDSDKMHMDVILNCWWFVHPTRGYVFFKHRNQLTPQCNIDKRIIDKFLATVYERFGFEIRFERMVVNRLPREVTVFNKAYVSKVLDGNN